MTEKRDTLDLTVTADDVRDMEPETVARAFDKISKDRADLKDRNAQLSDENQSYRSEIRTAENALRNAERALNNKNARLAQVAERMIDCGFLNALVPNTGGKDAG